MQRNNTVVKQADTQTGDIGQHAVSLATVEPVIVSDIKLAVGKKMLSLKAVVDPENGENTRRGAHVQNNAELANVTEAVYTHVPTPLTSSLWFLVTLTTVSKDRKTFATQTHAVTITTGLLGLAVLQPVARELKVEERRTAAQPLLIKVNDNSATPVKASTCHGDNGAHVPHHAPVELVKENNSTHATNPTKSKANTVVLIQDTGHGANGLLAAKHAAVDTQ